VPDPAAPDAGRIASAATGERLSLAAINPLVAALILALFVLSCLLSAARPGVTTGFDEVTHASFVAHIQQSGDAWPALDEMRLLLHVGYS
jgi:hypothetical protein